MKTPEDIKKAIKCHRDSLGHHLPCSDCAYHGPGLPPCRKAVLDNAIAYIEQLEEQIMCMKIQMQGDCGVCKHRSGIKINAWAIAMSKKCEECIMKESRPNWEYEGLPELPKKGES